MNQSRSGRGGKRAENNPELAQVVIGGSSQCSYVLTERQFLVQDDPKIPDRSGEEKGREFSRKGLRVITGSPHTRPNLVTAIVFALKSSAMYSCLYVFDEKNHYSIESKLDTCTHTVMPGSIEMSRPNYYFHQISSFCCFNVLRYYAVLITGGTYRSLVTPL